MNIMLEKPTIPPHLESYWTEADQDVHDRLASISLDDFWSTMPGLQRPRRGAGCVDLSPEVDHDRQSAVVVPLPFANGWQPHMAYRVKLIQNLLPVPTRVIAFPNNTVGNKVIDLDKKSLEVLESGDFQPIVDEQFRTLDELDIERVSYIGYSLGACVGAKALELASRNGYFDVGNSGLFEWVNGISRTEKQLRKDFTSDGLGVLNKAINESAIVGLSKAQRSRGGRDVVPQLLKIAKFGIGSMLDPVNSAVTSAMTHESFMRSVSHALQQDPKINILLARAENSPISASNNGHKELFSLLSVAAHRLRFHTIKGYSHEMGDNIVAHAILARMAITNS